MDKWYYNDWFLSFALWISFICAAVGNYILNGGQL